MKLFEKRPVECVKQDVIVFCQQYLASHPENGDRHENRKYIEECLTKLDLLGQHYSDYDLASILADTNEAIVNARNPIYRLCWKFFNSPSLFTGKVAEPSDEIRECLEHHLYRLLGKGIFMGCRDDLDDLASPMTTRQEVENHYKIDEQIKSNKIN